MFKGITPSAPAASEAIEPLHAQASPSFRQRQQSQQQGSTKQVWLEAWIDPVAGVKAYTPCVHTCNLLGDNDWRLVVADHDKKLKVWRGTARESEHPLLDHATALASFVPEDKSNARVPVLAVAIGQHVYMLRGLKPFYRFTLPPEPVQAQEEQAWVQLSSGQMDIDTADEALSALLEQGGRLTARSLELLGAQGAEAKQTVVQRYSGQPPAQPSLVTCMAAINQSVDEPGAASCLVLGTESGKLLLLNCAGTAVAHTISLGSPPAFLACAGLADLHHRIAVATRDGRLHIIKNGQPDPQPVHLETPAVGVVRLNNNVLVGCMNNVVHCYNSGGSRAYSLYLPAPLLTMAALEVPHSRVPKCLVLALANCEVRVYNEQHLVSLHTVPAPVMALHYGQYGREGTTLIAVLKSGALDIRMLPRTAQLEAGAAGSGPQPEQDVPLQIPKTTRLSLQQAQRERVQGVAMHRSFQRDLVKTRLAAARAYVKVLTDGQGASAFNAAQLNLTVGVTGLGPRFRVTLTLLNQGEALLAQVPVMLEYDRSMYACDQRQLLLPALVPSLEYRYSVQVRCLQPDAPPGIIRILLLKPGNCRPLLVATLKMPPSELEDV